MKKALIWCLKNWEEGIAAIMLSAMTITAIFNVWLCHNKWLIFDEK